MRTDDPRFTPGYREPPPLVNPRVPCIKCRALIYRDAKRCRFCGKVQHPERT